MQEAADEEEEKKQEERNEKHQQLERTKQKQTIYVDKLMCEMIRLDIDTDVGTSLKKNEELISRCLTEAGISFGKKYTPAVKRGQGLLPKKTVALEGHHAVFAVTSMQYTEETWSSGHLL